MLAVDDCHAYWQHVDPCIPASARAAHAFENRWFGTKSEARVRTIMTDMIKRFDAFPDAFALLRGPSAVPAHLRPFICHLHTQLADPVYRQFSGEFLAERREHGHANVDRAAVARWIDELEPGRWSTVTCIKFASNLLATALDVGLVRGRRDPRPITLPPVPDVVIAYALYLLRGVDIEGTLTDNPYLRSLGVTPSIFPSFGARLPGIRVDALGGHLDVTFRDPSLSSWGRRALRGEA